MRVDLMATQAAFQPFVDMQLQQVLVPATAPEPDKHQVV
jgi:hypothetical protein